MNTYFFVFLLSLLSLFMSNACRAKPFDGDSKGDSNVGNNTEVMLLSQ